MQRAVACRHWRETYTATTRPDGTVVEGYVDLIYRDDDGSLVVIDYKARRSSRRSTVRARTQFPPEHCPRERRTTARSCRPMWTCSVPPPVRRHSAGAVVAAPVERRGHLSANSGGGPPLDR